MKYTLICFILFSTLFLNAQTDTMSELNKVPYYEIPDYPENYSAGNVVARVLDGLGYRYYWATEGLREEDYNYRPSDDSRTIGETMEHVYNLSNTILRIAKKEVLERGEKLNQPTTTLRKMALENMQTASQTFKGMSAEEIAELSIIFKREDRTSEFPFWHVLNGQLADAIYHSGQIAAFRRASGNPVDSKMNVFMGKNRE